MRQPGSDIGRKAPWKEDGERQAQVVVAFDDNQLAMRLFGGHAPAARRIAIPWRLVADIGTVVRLGVSGDDLDAGWVERWVSRHLIGRIPGGRHDPE